MLLSVHDRASEHPSTLSAKQTGHDSHSRDPPSPKFDDDFDIFGTEMIPGTGGSSPFIKDEPNEWSFNDPPNMNPEGNNFGGMPMNSFNGHIASGSVDPSDLHGAGFNQFTFGNDPMSNSLIGDDELTSLDLTNNNKQVQQQNNGMSFYNNGQNMQPPRQQSHQQMFSQTPAGEPMASPYLQGVPHSQVSSYQSQHFHGQQAMSPFMGASRSGAPPLSREASYMSARPRNSMSIAMERKPSDQRTPMTPRTPAIGQLNLGTPEAGSMPQHIPGMGHRHQKSISGQWESALGSYDSYAAGSPLGSPGHLHHNQISEVLKGGKPSSLPNKVDHPGTGMVSQEAKRRRRRESHNLVERRRRDNINERIQELAILVPAHRLEDEKVRKHLTANAPISPGLTGVSPPHSSMLGQKRNSSAGNITMGLPLEDKDKGPNKGDILNGSVAWTRDLVWYVNMKMQQESQLREYIENQLHGTWPFGETDDEKRMQSELVELFDKVPLDTIDYSRGHGSGLRVPKYTNLAGEPTGSDHLAPSDATRSRPGGISSLRAAQQEQFWAGNSGGAGNLEFTKEEDETMF